MHGNNSLATEIHFPPLVLGESVEDISIPCGVFAGGCLKADENEVIQKMLPPLKYTMEHYKNNKKKGRPRTKRIRGSGDMPGDGGGKLGSQRKAVRCERSAGSQEYIKEIDFSDW